VVRYLDWILDLGFASGIILSVKVKVLRGSFDLWLGDNIPMFSMVKQAHLLFSNRLWAHPIFGHSNRWKIDWEDLLSYICSCSQSFCCSNKNLTHLLRHLK
jgi:hypothetical protein